MRPTEPKLYRYPRSIEVGKTICKFSIGVLLLLIVLVIIVDDFPPYHTIAERLFAALFIALVIIGDIYFIYSWPKIKVDENGLHVEFLWKWIRIPWQDIDGVVEKNFSRWLLPLRMWMVKSHQLTTFHMLYGLYGGIVEPCFWVSPLMQNHLELIDTIKQRPRHRQHKP